MKSYWKFAALVAVIVGTLIWLAVGGTTGDMTYYKTVAQLDQMGNRAQGKRLRVGGDVEPGSINRKGGEVSFVLVQDRRRLKVVYHGTEPLPDTFRDGAQALADGRIGSDGVFLASQISAKCASKYEAKPGGGQHPANINKAGA
ncbi:MAG: cytochrome c maturation protein CcmE [Bryobacteraceae bacterium]